MSSQPLVCSVTIFNRGKKLHLKLVVLNHWFVSRMRPPSTLCAVLSSLSIKSLIFCVTDLVLL